LPGIDPIERLVGIGQRVHQGMVTLDAIVGDINPLLALAFGGDRGAVDVEDRLVQELGRLLGPDAEPGLVGGLHQAAFVAFRLPED
jgi:hypothetical protein